MSIQLIGAIAFMILGIMNFIGYITINDSNKEIKYMITYYFDFIMALLNVILDKIK